MVTEATPRRLGPGPRLKPPVGDRGHRFSDTTCELGISPCASSNSLEVAAPSNHRADVGGRDSGLVDQDEGSGRLPPRQGLRLRRLVGSRSGRGPAGPGEARAGALRTPFSSCARQDPCRAHRRRGELDRPHHQAHPATARDPRRALDRHLGLGPGRHHLIGCLDRM